MKWLKRFNVLDYIIAAALLLAVVPGVWNFFLAREEQYKIRILLEEKTEAEIGDSCGNFASNREMGKVLRTFGKEAEILVSGRKEKHGVRVEGTIYLKNMPLELSVGDTYAKGKIKEIVPYD